MNEHAALANNLKKAKALIATTETWTKGAYARDENGVDANAEYGYTCLCSIGACIVAGLGEASNATRALDAEANIMFRKEGYDECGIIDYNDMSTHAEVMGVWNKAIATAEANAVVLNLEMAKDKITIEDNWIKGNYATDINGDAVDTTSVSATCFCAFGAIEVVSAKPHQELYTRTFSKEPEYEFLDKAAISLWHTYDYEEYGNNAAGYNDAPTTTHANILALFDAAIVLAKAAV